MSGIDSIIQSAYEARPEMWLSIITVALMLVGTFFLTHEQKLRDKKKKGKRAC